MSWSIKVPVRRLRMTSFGVYPLAASALSSIGAALDTSRTFLPYWPGRHAISPLPIAWVWPLADQPRQSACPGPQNTGGLVNDGLAASLASGGRLSGLLATGASYATKAHLTWAIDPALLANVRTMTSPYLVSSSGQCNGPVKPASRAARSWLAALKSAVAGQPVFVTPYADVDATALVHAGLNTDLTNAFTAGRSVAGQILGRDFSPEKPGKAAPGDRCGCTERPVLAAGRRRRLHDAAEPGRGGRDQLGDPGQLHHAAGGQQPVVDAERADHHAGRRGT